MISIVTISFNQSDYLRKSVAATLNQGDYLRELVIVDPGSTDGSREFLKTLTDPKVVRIFEPDFGPADGLNNGFSRATGDILGFINSDDFLLPNSLLKVTRFFEANPTVELAIGNGFVVQGDGHVTRRVVPDRMNLFMMGHGACSIFQPAVFFRKAAFMKTRGFNTNNKTCWDSELFMDLIKSGARVAVLREPLAAFRLHGASITGRGDNQLKFQADQNRIYLKIFGRNRNMLDRFILAPIARVLRLVLNPYSAAIRIVDYVERKILGRLSLEPKSL